MSFAEKARYHQIHPAKLATDIAAEIVSLYIIWQHLLVLGLVSHFLPPVVASFLVMRFADLEKQKHSRFGRYVGRMMTRPVEAVRLGGDLIMVFGAWYHSFAIIGGGLSVVLLAWLSGLPRRPGV